MSSVRPATRLLIITLDRVAKKMAGPGIRAFEIARSLATTSDVHLLCQGKSDIEPVGFRLSQLSKATLGQSLEWADAVMFQGYVLHLYPELVHSGKPLICDVYDPLHLESLEMNRLEEQERRLALARSDLGVINEQLMACDFFVCASEKQRDMWIGHLAALGRLDPAAYDRDPSLRSLIDVVPFGIAEDPPDNTQGALRGKWPGIGADDRIIIWGGGIYNWFDPQTTIKAIDRLKGELPNLRLFFMGLGHPNPEVPEMRVAVEAVRLAEQLGLKDKHVFFNEGWVPYEQRAGFLCDADIGISCHHDHVETRFSYRTRVLDYFWADLPVVVTEGDALGDLVEERGLGATVPPDDPAAVADALRRMLTDAPYRERCERNIAEIKSEMVWSRTVAPLVRFLKAPTKSERASVADAEPSPPSKNPAYLFGRVLHYFRSGGFELVRAQTRKYLSRSRSR